MMTLPQTIGSRLEIGVSTRQGVLGSPGVSTGGFMTPVDPRGPMPVNLSLRQQLNAFRGWTYVAVDRIATCCSAIEPTLGRVKRMQPGERQRIDDYTRQYLQIQYGITLGANQDWESIERHPALDLLACPNEEDSWMEFAYELNMFLDLCGEFYIWKIRNGLGKPAKLWVVPNDMIRPEVEWVVDGGLRYASVRSWVIQVTGGGTIQVPAGDIVRGKRKNPLDKAGAYSATQAATPWLLTSESIDTSQYLSFAQGTHSDVALLLDKDVFKSEPKEEILDAIRLRFVNRATSLLNAGPVVMPPGITLHNMKPVPKEMDYTQSDVSLRDKILAARGINKFAVGISEDMNRGDTQEAMRQFWIMCGDPRNRFVASVLTRGIVWDWDTSRRTRLVFPSGAPEDDERRRADLKLQWETGAASPDDIRETFGRPGWNIPPSRIGYVPSGLLPLPDAMLPPEPDDTVDEPEPGDDDDAKPAAKAADTDDESDDSDE